MKKKFSRLFSLLMVVCLLCPSMTYAECKHVWKFEYDPYSIYECIDNTSHIMVANGLHRICTKCSERYYEEQLVNDVGPESHRYNSNGVCYECGYVRISEEVHEHKWYDEYDTVSIYECIDDMHHILVATEIYRHCKSCDERKIDRYEESGAVESAHYYGSNGKCVSCGYKKKEEDYNKPEQEKHQHNWYGLENGKSSYLAIDETYHKITAVKLNFVCTDCGEAKQEDWEIDGTPEEHRYNSNGGCNSCGYVKIVVTPTPTVRPTAVPASTPTFVAIPTELPTVTPKLTLAPTKVPTATPKVTNSATKTPIATDEPTIVPTELPVVTLNPTEVPTEVLTVTPKPTESLTPSPTVHICTYKESHWYQNYEYYNEEKHSCIHIITPECTVCGKKGERTNKTEYGKHKIEDGVCTKCKAQIGLAEVEKEYIQEQIEVLSELLNTAIKLKEMNKISSSYCAAIAQIISNKIGEYNQARDGLKSLDEITNWMEISELKEIYERRGEVENYTYKVDEETVVIDLENPDNKWYYIDTDSAEQILFGNFSEKVTLKGTIGQIIAGEIPFLATAADIRDFAADVIYWEWTKEHLVVTSLDLVGLIPFVGALKYADEASIVAKGIRLSDEASDALAVAVKNADELGDSTKHSDELGEAIKDALNKHADSIEGAVVDVTTTGIKNLDDLKTVVKNPEIFSENALEHIFKGNNTGGFHYEGLEDAVGEVIEVTKKPNAQGVYEARVTINGKTKSSLNTFFPKGWTPEQVVDAIEEAYNSMVYTGRRNIYEGYCSHGIKIELYLDLDTNKIISAYPKMQ